MYWLTLFFSVFGILSTINCETCSSRTMRQCKDSIDRSIQKRINEMSRQDMVAHCNTVRGDFNCLLRETRCLSSESERKRNGDALRNAMIYIRDGCDSLGGGWKDRECFIGESMKTCENTYPVHSGQFSSSTTENCRKYTQFYDCVMRTIKDRCRDEDMRYQGQYLVDKVQELAWNCEDHTSGSSSDYDRGSYRDREFDNGRGSYDRDRYDSRNRDGYRDRDRYPGDYRSDRLPGDDRRDRDSRYPSSDRRGGYDDRYGSDRNHGYSNSNYGYGSTLNDRDICCRNEYCSRSRMENCRDALVRTVEDRQSGGYQQDEQKCRKTRNDFNCLLWQSTCPDNRNDRDRNSDIFRKAKDYISRSCDTYGRWNENSCYKSSQMQQCETYLSNTRSGANYESCRSYNNFKDCMTDALKNCAKEDELYQGAYLVDKAMEMSWQCTNTESGSSSSSNRNEYHNDRDRDRYSPSNDRRNYNSRDDSYESYGSYEENPHLDDEEQMCSSRIQSYVDICKRDADEKHRQLIIESDFDVKQKGKCCATKRLRSCILDATKRICQRERGRVADSLIPPRYRRDLYTEYCRRLYDSDCNSSNTMMASTFLTLFLLALLFQKHSSSF